MQENCGAVGTRQGGSPGGEASLKRVARQSPPVPSCSALILCAGCSSRMGGLKPLLPLDGQTLIERIIRLFRQVGIEDILAVLGHEAERILPLLEQFGVDPVINERFTEGMFSSVQAGVGRINRNCRAFFLLPVDIPLVRPETLQALLAAFEREKGEICHPTFRGKHGHPPLLSAALIPEILDFQGEGGLRALLSRYKGRTTDVVVDDPGILLDLDTREDYEKALRDLR